jgi:23S rRNA (uracil1939-C5)-methyltransferase
MKRGDIIEVTIESAAFEGKSVARVDGFVLFVQGAVPGDRARVTVTRTKKSFAEAELIEVLQASPLRAVPQCRHFGTCGGCKWQHVAYEAQCDFKRQHVVDALERIGGFPGIEVAPTLGAASPYYYRNKMEFSFGQRWRTREEMAACAEGSDAPPDDLFALGLHIAGRYDRIIDLDECWLQSPVSVRIVNAVRAYSLEHALPVYSTESHTGYLRNLVIREGRRTGERMVNLVTRDDREDIMTPLTAYLCAAAPEITTVVNNITQKVSQVALGESERVYFGSGTIREKIGARTYRISANSFFQTNTEQAEELYNAVARMAAIRSGDVVYDLYSGTGTIALHVADDAKEVIGIESVASSVDDAHKNAAANGVGNCRFLLGDLKETLLGSRPGGTDLPRPDVVILDPPRAGVHERVAREVRALAPRTIVYVSCNPATQARDLKILCEDGHYRPERVQPVDMFPHTYHIENIVSLKLAD